MHTQRGKFLSALILLNGSAITLATMALVISADMRRALGYLPDWFSPFLVIFLLARLAALFAIWGLKRWGVLAFLLLECSEVAMGLFVFSGVLTFPLRALLAVPSFLALAAVWFLALRPRWQWLT